MAYKDPVKQKEWQKEYRKKNNEKLKERQQEYREKNNEKLKEKRQEYREKNKEKLKEKQQEYYEKQNQHAVDSITSGEIIDQHKWDMWCNRIKRNAKNKHPYPEDFTNDIMFEMMTQGCFYCGDLATTIDRIDSKLDHTLDNCVGCCYGCNMSKGIADPSTFIRKAYYRIYEEYVDDDNDIWFVHKTKPDLWSFKIKANKKGVSFELKKEYWDVLIKDNCAYCKRSPTTWFGVDRIVPSLGYVIGNVTPCCLDCNVDKFEDDVDIVMARNERIVNRVIAGELFITKCEKVILHNGSQKPV